MSIKNIKLILNILSTHPDSLKDIRLLKELNNFKENVKDRIDYSKGLELNSQQLVYYYNILLNREYIGTESEFQSQWKSATNEFQGATKDFLQFILLKKYLNKEVQGYENYLLSFRKTSKSNDYITYIDSIYAKKNHSFEDKEYNTVLKDTLDNSYSLKEIIEKHKNKIIYIDFWASWCAPCRQEMKFYPNLKKSLPDSIVTVLFFSIDEKEDAWKSSIINTETRGYEHYLLRKDSPLFKFFNLSSIPRYIIIGKNGSLLSYDAPRPSEKEDLRKVIQNKLP